MASLFKGPYLEGHGDLVSRLITPRSHMITPSSPILTHYQVPMNLQVMRGSIFGAPMFWKPSPDSHEAFRGKPLASKGHAQVVDVLFIWSGNILP